jgi:hypothetical protein
MLSKSELEETLEDVRVECTRCVQFFCIFLLLILVDLNLHCGQDSQVWSS